MLIRLATQDISSHTTRVHIIAEQGIQWGIQTSVQRVQEEGWARLIVKSIGTGWNPEETLYQRAQEKKQEIGAGLMRVMHIVSELKEEEQQGAGATDKKEGNDG